MTDREWVGLDIDEVVELENKARKISKEGGFFLGAFWAAIEAKLKEKNS